MLPLIAANLAAPDATPVASAGAPATPEGAVAAPADDQADGQDSGHTGEGETPASFGDVLRGEQRGTATNVAVPAAHSARGHARKATDAADSDGPATATAQAAAISPFYLLANWLPALAANTPHHSTQAGGSHTADGVDGHAPTGDIGDIAAIAGNALPHGGASPVGQNPTGHAAMMLMDDLPTDPVGTTVTVPASRATGAPAGGDAPVEDVDGVDAGHHLPAASLATVSTVGDGTGTVVTPAASALDAAHGDAPEPTLVESGLRPTLVESGLQPASLEKALRRGAPARNGTQSIPALDQASDAHVDAAPIPVHAMPDGKISSSTGKAEPSVAASDQPADATQPAGDLPRSATSGERGQRASLADVSLPASPSVLAGTPLTAPSTGLTAGANAQAAPMDHGDARGITAMALPLVGKARDARQGQGADPIARVIDQARVAIDTAPHTPATSAVSTEAGASAAGGKDQRQAVRGDAATMPASASDLSSAQVARLTDALPLVAARQGEPRAVSQPDTKRSAREKDDAKVEQAPSWRFQAWPTAPDGRNASTTSASSRDASAGQDVQRHESHDASGDTPAPVPLPATTPSPDTRHKGSGVASGAGAPAPQLANLAAIMQADVRVGATAPAVPVAKAADKVGQTPERVTPRHETDGAGDTTSAAVRHDQSPGVLLSQTPSTGNTGAVTDGAKHASGSGHGAEQLPSSLTPVVEGIVVRQASLQRGAAGSSFHVVLQPEALGTVRIRVENGHDGLRVTLAPQQQEAHGLLTHHLDDLVATLQRGAADDAARVHVDVLAPGGQIGTDTSALTATSAAHEAGQHHANSGGHDGNQGYEGGQGQGQSQDLAGNMGSMDGGRRQGAYRDEVPAWTPMDPRPAAANSYGWTAQRGGGSRDTATPRRAPHTARIDVQA